ncbi:hypothetical protein KFL_001570040 [Klebsormidium nitens]|uniref:RCC1-like domain-containing protein n=1 Tax=Klebsormidium nitens TaxID=105231 RepID=A0A0U9HJT6_KLENI|nr:hypothetical protein KFL_001570040 [Klebsormidium nitens]|eukprot:GAQ83665.1 hypothetical protein KFL_001570040 [Klebsormidium nitens]
MENDENCDPRPNLHRTLSKTRSNPDAPQAKQRRLKRAPDSVSSVPTSSGMRNDEGVRGIPSTTTALPDLPYYVLFHMLSTSEIGGRDLACLESAGYAFRRAADQTPYRYRSIAEMAAYEQCQRRPWLKQLPEKVQLALFHRCNRSWKRVLAYIGAVGSSTNTDDRFSGGQVSSGQYHNVAVTAKGAVYTFGGTEEGCLGRGSVNGGGNMPRPVPALRRIRVLQVSAGQSHTVLATSSGELYTFGLNQFGCCGHGSLEKHLVHEPRLVTGMGGAKAARVSAGMAHTVVATDQGKLYTFGRGIFGRLGLGTEADEAFPQLVQDSDLDDEFVTQVSAGVSHTLIVTRAGNLFSCGYGLKGRLGHGGEVNELRPRLVAGLQEAGAHVMQASAGPEHSGAVTADGRVYTWGGGWCGCLGHVAEENELAPREVEGLGDVLAVQIKVGKRKTFVVSDVGKLWAFGWSALGSLGYGETGFDKVPHPTVAAALVGSNVVQVAAGLYHTLVVTRAGDSARVLSFGDNEKGQLGVASTQLPTSLAPWELEGLEMRG